MLFSFQSSDSLNALSTTSLNPSALQRNSTAALYTAPTGLADLIQQSDFRLGSSASSITATTEFTPLSTSSVISDRAFDVVSDVSVISTNIYSPSLDTTTELTPFIASSAVSDSVFNVTRDLSVPDLDTRSSNKFTDQVYKYQDSLWLGDDTQDTARDIGRLSNSTVYSFNDSVGNSDRTDFYKFTLDGPTSINLALTGLNAPVTPALTGFTGAPVTLSLYGPEGLELRYLDGSSVLKSEVGAGTYYVSVNAGYRATDYTLRIQATKSDSDKPTLLASTYDMGTLRGLRSFSDYLPGGTLSRNVSGGVVAVTHKSEQYHFNLASASDLSVSTDHGSLFLVQDANNNGIVDLGELIGTVRGGRPLSFADLPVGSYFLQVGWDNGWDISGSTSYNLNLTATPAFNSATTALMGSEPNDSLIQAIEIGSLLGQRSFRNTVGAADKNDFYRFNLPGMSNLNLSLSGLTANADVQVIRDVNQNGTVDLGEVVASSTLQGTASELINLQGLDTGFYFVRVDGAEDNTSYTLNLTGTPGQGVAPEPNNTLATAYNMGTLNTFRQFGGFVGWSDPDDYYRFTLGTSRQVDLMLWGMSAFADLQLLDSQGAVIANDSAYDGHYPVISRPLAPGDYMVRVQHYEDPDYFPVNQDTQYMLNLAA